MRRGTASVIVEILRAANTIHEWRYLFGPGFRYVYLHLSRRNMR
jgi:hypothetical protein